MLKRQDQPLPEGRAFIELLAKIEKRVNPVQCRFFHYNYWPLMRFMINAKRKFRTAENVQAAPKLEFEQRKTLYRAAWEKRSTGSEYLNDLLARSEERGLNDQFLHLPRTDHLFLTRKSQYRHAVGGVTSEPLTDGLRYLNLGGPSQLTLVDDDPRVGGSEFLLPTEVLPYKGARDLLNLLSPPTLAELWARNRILRTVAQVNATIPEHFSQLRISENEALIRVKNCSQRLMHWIAILNHIKPKAVFLSSYTGVSYLCAAGKRLGIPVIDIQHGGMHQHHPLVSKWHKAPKNGYELLPDIFWCWDSRSAGYINSSRSSQHRAIVGGNPKTALDYKLLGELQSDKDELHRPQVLVGLQYGGDPMIEPHVKQAYLATKDQLDWRFRLHPLGHNYLDEVVREFDVSRECILAESAKPLHQVLPEIDLMLCNASTIIYEALDYGANAAVWSHKGAAVFEELVVSGQISVATNQETLVDVLSKIAEAQASADPRPTAKERQTENISVVSQTFAKLTG